MLSQTAEYALRAVVFLAEQHGSPRTTRDIAEATRVPNGYLAKVLQALSRGNIVRSQRGLHGGFSLAQEPAATSLLDVIRVVEPIRRIHACPLELPEHADALCPLHQRLDDAMASIERSFSSTTIADLLTDGTPASEHFPALGPHPCNGACRAAAARTDARDESAPHEELS